MTIANHHIEIELIEGNGIPSLPKDAINLRNLNIIVDKMLLNPNLDAVWMPAAMKRDLFFHILYIFLTVMQIFVGSYRCDVLGHVLAASISKRDIEPARRVRRSSQVNNADLNRYLEAGSKGPRPVSIQGDVLASIMKIVYVMVLVIIDEVFADFRLNLIGESVKFTLGAGKPPSFLTSAYMDEEQQSRLRASGKASGKELPSGAGERDGEKRAREEKQRKVGQLQSERAKAEARLAVVSKQIAVCEGEIALRLQRQQAGGGVGPVLTYQQRQASQRWDQRRDSDIGDGGRSRSSSNCSAYSNTSASSSSSSSSSAMAQGRASALHAHAHAAEGFAGGVDGSKFKQHMLRVRKERTPTKH
jgi:hypothetical protein